MDAHPPLEPLREVTAHFLIAVRHAARGPRARDLLRSFTGIDATGLERLILLSVRGQDLVSSSQLADELRVTPSTLSRSCGRLEARGDLFRLTDPRDRRRTLVGLTDRTAAALRAWDTGWPRVYAEPVVPWPERDRSDLGRWLAVVRYELLGVSDEPHDRHAWTPPADRPDLATPSVVRFANAARDLVGFAGRSDLTTQVAAASDHALGEGAFFTLFAINEMSRRGRDAVAIRDLALHEAVDPSLTRRTVGALARAGLVESRAALDRAGATASLSAAGRDLLGEVNTSLARRLPRHPGSAAPAERVCALLASYLGALSAGAADTLAGLQGSTHESRATSARA